MELPRTTVWEAGVAEIVKSGPDGRIARLSKLVFHPLLLASVTGEHGVTQPVVIVFIVPAATAVCALGWPAQLMVTVELPEPPLYAWRPDRPALDMNVKLALV